ncbi:hypothetical protein AMATHDRAFT_74232 [Amanita thiersii Skay4041]|uniref:Uncharacterized protein n=1 Tax=Amanita thiersii Skay4041 TaxID=703135 RepID=A0A2A9NXA1_9AGAR|nr:hypothetical protein AMATHDRAFT_74232 [Amanita thiersii Skay4041]
MASDPLSLTTIARNKMHSSFGSRDNCSLHRWVLLKNSISVSQSPTLIGATINTLPDASSLCSAGGYDDADDRNESGDSDSFFFPDAGQIVSSSQTCLSEAQWLDTLLKELGEDEDDDYLVESDVASPPAPVEDDDEDAPLSPLVSPMASSDDLHNQPQYYSPPRQFPYPRFLHPLLHPFDFDQGMQSSISSLPPPYDDPLPYHNIDDTQEYAVPDTIIEDISDDESDTPSTPSYGRSSASLSLSDIPSIPSPTERSSRTRQATLQVYDDKDVYFYPSESDPLPFSNDHHSSYNAYRAC